jgi:hypothetical protein
MTTGIVCPGYDRTGDNLFLNETTSVVIKARKSKAKAIAVRGACDPASIDESVALLAREPTPGLVLLAPLVDQGLHYFMSRYMIGMDEPPFQSEEYHKHLATNGFHPLVATSMTALGLAGVANIYADAALKRKATRLYLDAIKMANTAISAPDQVKSDTTLIAITLLGMFEATINEYSFSEWSNHVNGAAALVKIRGVQQLSTPAGRRMYMHSIGMLAMNCLGAGKPMPPYVDDLNKEIIKYLDISDPRERFFFLNNRIINLRAHIMRDPGIPLQDVITLALELDVVAACIFDDAGPEWTYEQIICKSDSPLVFGDSYHIYSAHSIAQTYNWVRYSRIYLHDIIRNAALAALSASPPAFNEFDAAVQLSNSNAILQDMQNKILASIPQFLHDVPSVSSGRSASPPLSSSLRYPKNISQNFAEETILHRPSAAAPATHRIPIVRVSGGHSTVWALYIAGSMPTATKYAQRFSLVCLERFAREFGINQAKLLARSLEVMMQRERRDERICPAYLPE